MNMPVLGLRSTSMNMPVLGLRSTSMNMPVLGLRSTSCTDSTEAVGRLQIQGSFYFSFVVGHYSTSELQPILMLQ